MLHMSDIDPMRSRMMAAIGSRHTRPEMVVRKALFARGFRYRLNVRTLPGSPDLVFPARQAVILVHGCFWHRHEACRYFRLPKTRPEFWNAKLSINSRRDVRDVEALRLLGWRVAVVWECATRDDPARVTSSLERFLKGDEALIEISG